VRTARCFREPATAGNIGTVTLDEMQEPPARSGAGPGERGMTRVAGGPVPFAGFTAEDLETTPIERAWTIPSRWYTDPAFHAIDADAVFARTWQGVGHLAQVREPGMYFTTTVADSPVIVLRDKEGVLRAFYNVCRHRGGPLATEAAGCVKALTCQYHGWTYLLDGSLRGVPRWDRVDLFDKKDYGLTPIRVETWQDQVFVNLDAQAAPLAGFVDGIAERIAPVRLDAMTFVKRIDYEVACNWKVYVDNFLEGYHVPYVHPELMKLYDFRQYATELFPHHSLQWSPLAPGDAPYDIRPGDNAYYYCLFPNYMLNILPGRVQTNLVVPVGHDRCRVEFSFFYRDATGPAAERSIADDLDYSDRVQREDMDICAHVQRGLGSRAYDRGRFSVDAEQGVHHFQEGLRAAYRAWSAAPRST
jgi:choline monooxygenase